MPGHIGLRRLIQQNAYFSDSPEGRRVAGNFCAGFRLPDGKRIRNLCSTGKIMLAPGDSLDLGVNPEACARKRVMAGPMVVIASEARQSMAALFRRWIATACGLAMTKVFW